MKMNEILLGINTITEEQHKELIAQSKKFIYSYSSKRAYEVVLDELELEGIISTTCIMFKKYYKNTGQAKASTFYIKILLSEFTKNSKKKITRLNNEVEDVLKVDSERETTITESIPTYDTYNLINYKESIENMTSIPPKTKQFLLLVLEGLSFQEIADRFNTSRQNVNTLIKRLSKNNEIRVLLNR